MTTSTRNRTTPLHLWIVGGLSLLWNAFGAVDYLMTQLRVPAYLAQLTPEQLAYLEAFPLWMEAAWAVGVWASLAGSVALLFRSRWAVALFGASLIGFAASSVYTWVLTDGGAMMGPAQLAITVVIGVVLVGLLGYARWLSTRGVLR